MSDREMTIVGAVVGLFLLVALRSAGCPETQALLASIAIGSGIAIAGMKF